MKHTDNYYANRIRKILKPIFDDIEKAYPENTIYPYINSWSRSNPFEKGVNVELCGRNKAGMHWSALLKQTGTYEQMYEWIKNEKDIDKTILYHFKLRCLKIQ